MSEVATKRNTEIGRLLPSTCTACEQGLLWHGESTKAELQRIGKTLQQIDRGNSWWWGDFLNKIVELHIAEWKAEQRKQGQLFDAGEEAINRRSLKYLTTYAESSGLSSDTLWVRHKVAAFYPIDVRTQAVSFEHYREAMVSGSLANAIGWLRKAADGAWTISDMRAHMRKELRGADGQPPMDGKTDAVLSRVECWAADLLPKADSLPKERSVRLLEHLSATAQLIDRLRANAGLLVGSSR